MHSHYRAVRDDDPTPRCSRDTGETTRICAHRWSRLGRLRLRVDVCLPGATVRGADRGRHRARVTDPDDGRRGLAERRRIAGRCLVGVRRLAADRVAIRVGRITGTRTPEDREGIIGSWPLQDQSILPDPDLHAG